MKNLSILDGQSHIYFNFQIITFAFMTHKLVSEKITLYNSKAFSRLIQQLKFFTKQAIMSLGIAVDVQFRTQIQHNLPKNSKYKLLIYKMSAKQQKQSLTPGQRLLQLSRKACSPALKCLLIEGFMQQLKHQVNFLKAKIEQITPTQPGQPATNECPEERTPQEEEASLWESIDWLETRIIENKEVVLHFKSIVECYDEEEDDLIKVLEVKREVSAALSRKIEEARKKLKDKVLTKPKFLKAKEIHKDMSKSVSTIHSEDTYVSERSERRSSLAASFFSLWK